MIILDPDLLEEFRRARRCEWCGKPNRHGLDPHHLWCRGMGGGSRLDIRINLMSLCRIPCHNDADGKIPRRSLLEIVAKREGRTPDDIEEEIWLLRRTPGKEIRSGAA